MPIFDGTLVDDREMFGPVSLVYDADRGFTRDDSGELMMPDSPVVSVRWYSEELGHWEDQRVSFGVLEALAPALYLHIEHRIREKRGEAAAAFQEREFAAVRAAEVD